MFLWTLDSAYPCFLIKVETFFLLYYLLFLIYFYTLIYRFFFAGLEVKHIEHSLWVEKVEVKLRQRKHQLGEEKRRLKHQLAMLNQNQNIF